MQSRFMNGVIILGVILLGVNIYQNSGRTKKPMPPKVSLPVLPTPPALGSLVDPGASCSAPSAADVTSVVVSDIASKSTSWYHQDKPNNHSIHTIDSSGRIATLGENYEQIVGPFFPDRRESVCDEAMQNSFTIDLNHCVQFSGSAPALTAAKRADGKTDIVIGDKVARTVDAHLGIGYLNQAGLFPEPPLPMIAWIENGLGRIEIGGELLDWECTLTPNLEFELNNAATIPYPVGPMTVCGRQREVVMILYLKTDMASIHAVDTEGRLLTQRMLPRTFHLHGTPPNQVPSPDPVPTGGVTL